LSVAWRVAWYGFRATFRRRSVAYLTLALLIGSIGGLSMAAVAGARRTQSSYPSYLASTNPPDLGAFTAVLNPLIGSKTGYNPDLLRTIDHLPHVQTTESETGLDVLPLGPDGRPYVIPGFPPSAGNGLALDEYTGIRGVSIVAGRFFNPARRNEIIMQEQVAALAHVHVGDRLTFGLYTNAQTMLPGFGTASVRPYRRATFTIVGTFIASTELVEDDVDQTGELATFTPAFSDPYLSCCGNYTGTAVKVAGGSRNVPTVAAELERTLPKGFPSPSPIAAIVAKVERAIRPESLALGVFGGIVALAALLIAGQVIGRQLRLAANDLDTLRAIGASPSMTLLDSLIGIIVAILVGSILAFGVAVSLSPLAVIGPVRAVYPPVRGVSIDWTVLGFGTLVLVVGLIATAVVFAFRGAPHRRTAPGSSLAVGGTRVSRTAAASGLPVSAVAGLNFAFEPGTRRNSIPVRSAIFGAALAAIVLIGTITFWASLDNLVAHPALYGWNWNYMLSGGTGSGDIPQQKAASLLDHDPFVKSWSGAYFADLSIDRQFVPVLGEQPGATVQPRLLSGHRLEASDQVVLGPATLTALHKRLGDDVTLDVPVSGPTSLTIVGTATMPTIGAAGEVHLEMGSGALLSSSLIPAGDKNPFDDPVTGPVAIFVDLRSGVNPAAALHSLDSIAIPLSNNFNFGVAVVSVLHPAEITNYRSMGITPVILSGALGFGAVVGLFLTLLASVRRRRHDLALLKTLGFTRRQLLETIAWQSSVTVTIGTAVGIPVGIAIGRLLWIVFAHEIFAVPAPSVPVLVVTLIALGAIALANLAAVGPGLLAARTPTAIVLREE
jgi:hypothetical protein